MSLWFDEYSFANSRTERRKNGERGRMKLRGILNVKRKRGSEYAI